jgi:RHH-type proline utilization regulon transcriptional repressor/proline dehydrogenase/delta 1-pyrroline-5-carboxylate dehydrogenase
LSIKLGMFSTLKFITRSEAEDLRALVAHCPSAPTRQATAALTQQLVEAARARQADRPYLDAFLQEFGLSNQEGIALMCLAESLLRIPDAATADTLIAEKLAVGDWHAHAGKSDSLFVNASTWGLMLTGRLIKLPDHIRREPQSWLRELTHRASEPLIREALKRAMQIMGGEFVVGRDIGEALARARDDLALKYCSFDVLGEGARTERDAHRYFEAYQQAIIAIAKAGPKQHAISIKLSALHARYSLAQAASVRQHLLPRAIELARLAAEYDLPLTLDAEEQDRLEISLEILTELMRDPRTRDWSGLGVAVQAYGRRAPSVLEHILQQSQDLARPLSIRLVKGAYWDSEIKRAQERGLKEYPVYTRKVSTDFAYLACASILLRSKSSIYAQFATHNAHTITSILCLRDEIRASDRSSPRSFEFQRLHGMGTLLYQAAEKSCEEFPIVRVYAPVGPHAELLAYLVRRLLENGANTSFVNRFMDERVPVAELAQDPVAEVKRRLDESTIEHPSIPLPPSIYGPTRLNSCGVDFGSYAELSHVRTTSQRILNHLPIPPWNEPSQIDVAFQQADAAFRRWRLTPVTERAACLRHAADLLDEQKEDFWALLVQEAGKTLVDAIAEVREAIDFCRYYADSAIVLQAKPKELPGPTGEINELSHEARGVWVCISPWNFPLAIFAGQVLAALATGNTVVAKPAETTPRIAFAFKDLLHRAGVPRDALHVLHLIGRDFGEVALQQPSLAGVVFTGSTRTAQWLNRALAARDGAILPLIAETGGINAMVVDSTALIEQVVDDVVSSAFGSAGQRCSALRLLCLQDDIADRTLAMLQGAIERLRIGDPADPDTDVGPLISGVAADSLHTHLAEQLARGATLLSQAVIPPLQTLKDLQEKTGIDPQRFFAPTLLLLPHIRNLDTEAFGPILHVVRFKSGELDHLLAAIRASGYGLTLGIQSRLDDTRRKVFASSIAGNVYVNRNMIGAVVGVQPFGGTGLSGTGPKAGGPHYLQRFTTERTLTVNTTATGGNTALLSLE